MAQNQQLKKVDGSIIWTRKEEESKQLQNEDNNLSNDLTSQFEALVKQCHQILYNNGAIVGKKAMDDIMKILTLKLLQPLFFDGNILKTKYDELYEASDELIQKKLKKSYSQCIDLNKLCTDSAPFNEWKNIVQIILSKIIGNIYDDNDVKFNGDENAIIQIIDKINRCDVFNKLTREKKGIKYYDSISGGIYESFINKYLNGGGKDLGQFFTPRHMIDLMVYGLKLTDYININDNTSIYDPCSGSGGFLTRIYNCFPDINPINIYGGEVEKDTMKFCISNLLLTTSTFCENLVNKNSIVYDDRKKHNIIFTNPPFGTSMQYTTHKVKEGTKMIEKNGLEQEYDKTNPERKGKFKQIYPIKTNDGACLFTQKCVYKLKKNGVLSIVLPDGQLFFGKNFMKFRKWLSEQLNIKYIVQAPSGTFEHAGIKTCVIMGIKNGATEKIQFLKTDKQCNYLEKIVDVDAEDLDNCGYSFDPKDYLEDEYLSGMMTGSNVEWVELEDVCEINIGGTPARNMKEYWMNGSNLWVSIRDLNGSIITNTKEKITDIAIKNSSVKLVKKNTILMSFKLSIGKMGIAGKDLYTNEAIAAISSNDINIVDNRYIYLYLNNFDFSNIGKGGIGTGSLNKNSLSKFKIPLPSLEIQQNIITELEQLDEHTKTLKQLLEHTKKSKGKYEKYGLIKEIRKLFNSSELKQLCSVCEFQNGRNITKDKLINGKYPVVGGGKTPMGYHNKFNVNEYTIIISKDGSYAGYVNRYNEKVFVSNHGIYIDNINENIKCDYIYYYLKLSMQDKLYALQNGSAQPGVNKTDIEKISIPILSLTKQQLCITIYQQKEAKLKEYDQEIERIENNIKHNQELGKQIIEYYITADPQPNIDDDKEQIIESDIDDDINEVKVLKIKKQIEQDVEDTKVSKIKKPLEQNEEIKVSKIRKPLEQNEEVKVSKIKKLINQYDENIKTSTKQYDEEAIPKKIVKTYKKQIDDHDDGQTIKRIVKKNTNM